MLSLIDQNRVVYAFSFLVATGVLVLLSIVAWRVPETELVPFMGSLARWIGRGALPYSLAANVALLVMLRAQRRLYIAEIKRVADEKGKLQDVIDPARRRSGVDLERDQ